MLFASGRELFPWISRNFLGNAIGK